MDVRRKTSRWQSDQASEEGKLVWKCAGPQHTEFIGALPTARPESGSLGPYQAALRHPPSCAAEHRVGGGAQASTVPEHRTFMRWRQRMTNALACLYSQ